MALIATFTPPTPRRLTVQGADWPCFGVEFWIQAALFEHTGYANFTIEYDCRDLTPERNGRLTVRRATKRDGALRPLEGVEATVTTPPLDDARHSWKAVQAWAREIVATMQFTPWSN